MSEPRPLSLTDSQFVAVCNAAQPLQPIDRSAFLASIAAFFAGRSEVGDGELGRCIRELQHCYFKAPSGIDVVRSAPKQLDRLKRPATNR
jgi:hypothetical protein